MIPLTPAEEAALPWNDECRCAVAVFLKRYRDTGQPFTWIPLGFNQFHRPRGPEGHSDANLFWRPAERERTPRVDQSSVPSIAAPNALKAVCHDIEHCLYLVDAALSGQDVPADVDAVVAEGRAFFDNSWQEFKSVDEACEAFYFWMSDETLRERQSGEDEDDDD